MKNQMKSRIISIVISHIFALFFAATMSSAASAQICTVLCQAVGNGNLTGVNNAIAGGADVNGKDGSDKTALYIAAEDDGVQNHIAIINALLAAGANPNIVSTRRNETPLVVAAMNNFLNVVNVLLGATGIMVNLGDGDDETPLHYAAEEGHVDVVNALLGATGIDVDVKNDGGGTPLHSAVGAGHVDVVNALIMAGADLEIEARFGRTPLIEAVIRIPIGGNVMNVQALITGGANVNAMDDLGNTPLFYAVDDMSKTGYLAALLAVSTINVTVKNNAGNTAFHELVNETVENVTAANMLIAAPGIDLNALDGDGDTVYQKATAQGHTGIVAALDTAIAATCATGETYANGVCQSPTCGTGTTGTPNAQNECVCMDNTHDLITDTATNTQTCEMPSLTCNRGTTGEDGDGDGNCDCAGDSPVQDTTETCRVATDLQDCVNAGFMFFNPGASESGFCSNEASTPNCIGNASLNGDGTACECRNPAFPISENSSENTFSCRAIESAIDCGNGDLPDFYDGSTCVADCGEGFTNPENAGETCRDIGAADCGQDGRPNFWDGSMCVATCPDDRPLTESDGITCRPINAADCGNDNRPDFWNGSMCVADCGAGFINPANAGETCIEITAADCGQDGRPDFWDGSMCVADCGDSFVNPANAGETCRPIAEVLATVSVSPTYTAESCENARWETRFIFSENNRQEVAEVCEIPVMRDDSATVTVAAAAAEFAPLQFDNLSMATGCIIRESADFLTLPDCNDSQLFGDDGFPQMPADFNIANDRLIIVVVADGRNRIFFNDNEIRIAVAPPRNNDAEVAIIGAVGVAMAMYAFADFLNDGRPADAFAFSSDFGYSLTENDYFIRAGGKIEYAVNENLRMQWSAGQTNSGGDFGDFRYLSKAEYKTDLFAAEFSESVAGKTADYDFSLSADLQNGIWKISPVYRMQSEWKESDSGIKTETQNELNLESVLRYNRWTIRPSAGFRWQNFGEFTENGKLQMNAVYRF